MGTMQKPTVSIIQWDPAGEKDKKQFCSRKSGLLFCERKVQQKQSMPLEYLCRSANTGKPGVVQRTATEK